MPVLQRPVVRSLIDLMELRNSHPAFDIEGDLDVTCPAEGLLQIRRTSGDAWAQLDADLTARTFTISHS